MIVETHIGSGNSAQWIVNDYGAGATHARIEQDGSVRVLRARRWWFPKQLGFHPGASPNYHGRNVPVQHRVTT